MARESEFIDKLSDFTKSLESLVEILKEQEKNSPTEVLNKMLDNFDGNVLSTIAEDLTIVKKTTL